MIEAANPSANNPDQALQMAGPLFQSGQLDQAIKILQAARSQHPEHFDVNYGLAIIHATSGNLDAALPLFEKAVSIRPGDGEAQFNLGRALADAGRPDEAIAAYRRSLEINPREEAALVNLGNVLKDVSDFAGAADCFRQSLAINPNNAMVHTNLGNVLLEQEQLDDAIASYGEALGLNPELAVAHAGLGRAYKKKGQLEDACGSFQKVIAINPEYAEAHSNLAKTLKDLGQLEEAAASYQKAISIQPDFAEAHGNLGNVFKDLGRLDEALAEYQKAIDLNPEYAEAHSNLGNAFTELGRVDEAVASYNKAITITPDFAEAHYNLGNALHDLGQPEKAVASFHRALAIKPELAEAHIGLGNALREGLGTPEEAVGSYLKALAIKPDYVEAHINLGNALREQGRLDEAVASYSTAIAIEPDCARARKNLGMTQLLLGDFGNGWENFEYRWLVDDLFSIHEKYDKPLWDGADINGKRLLLWEEQGIGESVIFASIIPDLIKRGADVILECDKRLMPLFSRSFPSITCAAENDPDIGKTEDKTFDLHVPLGNPGRWFRADIAAFPARPSYLVADGEQQQTLRNRYLERGNSILVGIAWFSTGPIYGAQKSMTLHDLRPVLEMPGITFVDLQYGDTSQQRKNFTAETGNEVFHDDGIDQMVDLDLFASQVAAMDMVVTISNTTAHVAGALGIPTLLMLGCNTIWYWLLEREDSPWYSSLRLFRQQLNGDWQGVVEKVRKEVAGRLGDD
jgi:tetratricopeptide (TPR) repeat protein